MENKPVMINETTFRMVGYEPKKTNRFLIKTFGLKIPEYYFQSYKIYNIDNTIFFECQFFEPIEFSLNPFDLFKILEINLSHLDPIGEIISSYRFRVKNVWFEQIGNYKDDGILMNKLKFETYYWTKETDINSSKNENNKSN
jgi:hypothetical protein